MSLVPLDDVQSHSPAMREIAVSTYLEHAKTWLAGAVERTGPAEIASARAEIATAAEATKQLGLSKEIQLDATEMVRRAEFALAKSIRKGQDEGVITTSGQHASGLQGLKSRVPDFIPGGASQTAIFAMTDGVSPETFDRAVTEAKAEGSVSREAVARKIRGRDDESGPMSRQQRADVIADLAGQGYSSHQIATKVNVSAHRVREIGRSFAIDIPADKVVGRQVRIDYTAAVESAVTSLDNWASSLSFIDFTEVDGTEADEWVASLNHSLIELRRFIKQIKETTHV